MDGKSGEFTENTNTNPHITNISNAKIPNSSRSLFTPSDLSEPPDIKNWFSSYVYESPVLDTEDGLKLFVSGKSEIEKVGFDSEEQNQLGSEIPSSSCLSSKPDLSEPPDIRNWFSSYVYESPVLDTEDEFKCFISAKSEIEKVSLDSEKHNQLGTEGNCLLKRQRVTKICDDENFGSKLKETNDLAPHEGNTSSCLNDNDSIQKLESNFSLTEGLLENKDHKEDDTEGESCAEEADSEKVKKTPLKIPLSCSNGDGAKINESPADGFISTKKKKHTNENNRNRLKISPENHTEYIRKTDLKLPLNKTNLGLGRRPLSETTNLQYKVAMPESTGKWCCPQRSKPDLGPPLKQLRLEKWIRRVK